MMKPGLMSGYAGCAALALATSLMSAAAAFANDDTASATSQGESGGRVIEEVIVSATKRDESLREIPATIVALAGEDLEQMGAQGVDDFIKLSPGVTLSDDSVNNKRITIRGVSADFTTIATTGSLFGDTPLNDTALPRVLLDPNPFDLATVEILKGPQGTLFGGSALNGAVRYVPTQPRLEEWQGKAFLQFTDVEQGGMDKIYGAAINVPLGRSAALRFVGYDRSDPGWIDSTHTQYQKKDVNRTEQQGGRLMFRAEPGERWTISALVARQETLKEDVPTVTTDPDRRERASTPVPSPVETSVEMEVLSIEYAFPRFDLLSSTSHSQKAYDALLDASRVAGPENPPRSVTAVLDAESEGWTQEFRLTSNDTFEHWKWLGGLFAYQLDLVEVYDVLVAVNPFAELVPDLPAGLLPGIDALIVDGQPSISRFNPDVRVRELALFGDVTRQFPAFDVTLGLRLYRNQASGMLTVSGLLALTSGQLQSTTENDFEEQGISPRLSIKVPYNDNLMFYTTAARGFRFGGIQGVGDTLLSQLQGIEVPETYKSDTIWSYEAGVRSQWFDNSLVVDITPFYLEWDKPQIVQQDDSQTVIFIDNVGGARAQGVEGAIQWLPPLDGLTIATNFAFVRNKTTAPYTTSTGIEVPRGATWPLTAKWQTSSTVSYARNFGPVRSTLSLTHTYSSRAPFNLEKSFEVFGKSTVDASINLSHSLWPGRPQLQITVSNLTDKRVVIGGENGPTTIDRVVIRPRTVIARLSVDF